MKFISAMMISVLMTTVVQANTFRKSASQESFINDFRLGYASCVTRIKSVEDKMSQAKKAKREYKFKGQEEMRYNNCYSVIQAFELKTVAAWLTQKVESVKEEKEKSVLNKNLEEVKAEVRQMESESD